MKKITLVIAFLAISVLGANAQVFQKGSGNLNLGIGFGSPFVYGGSESNIPPISASYELGVSDKIGIGGLVGYTSSSLDFDNIVYSYDIDGNINGVIPGTATYTWSYLIIGARGNYHFVNKDKIDVYAGAMLGYNIVSSSIETTPNDPDYVDADFSVSGLAYGGHLGVRYMFSDKVGAFTEVGYNVGYVNLGLTVKM
jgi:hypothetical protein